MDPKCFKDVLLPATDPVCGMRIQALTADVELRVYREQTYVFCSADCAMKFDNDSEAYVAAIRILGEKYGRATSAAEEERLLRDSLPGFRRSNAGGGEGAR